MVHNFKNVPVLIFSLKLLPDMVQLCHRFTCQGHYINRKLFTKLFVWDNFTMETQRKLNEEVISCIMISMLDLLRKKDFDKISIIEIIEHAGVSRNSFYRNFKDKEDILVRYIESITEDFIKSASIPVFMVYWRKYISAILNHMYENRDLVSIFF